MKEANWMAGGPRARKPPEKQISDEAGMSIADLTEFLEELKTF